MRTTPLPFLAALALGCVGGKDSTTIAPMVPPHTSDTGDTVIPPMVPPDSADTSDTGGTVIPPMVPPDSADTSQTGDTGSTAAVQALPSTPRVEPKGLSPLPSAPILK